MDMMLPFQAYVVREQSNEKLVSSECEASNLKNTILNLSGGGLNFRSRLEFLTDDMLKMILTIPVAMPRTICLYGKVIKSDRTEQGNFKVRVRFEGITERIRDILISFILKHERDVLISSHLTEVMRFTDVSVLKFAEGTNLPFEIYTVTKKGLRFMFDSGLPYDGLAKEYFNEMGISKVYVKQDDVLYLNRYLDRVRGVKIKPFDREDQISFKEYSFRKLQLHCIGRNILLPRTSISFNLYRMEDYNYKLFLESSASIPLMLDDNIPSMQADFLVGAQEVPAYLHYLKALPLNSSPLVLKEKACIIMHDILDKFGNKETIASAIGAAREIVAQLEKAPDSFYAMLSAGASDFYPYAHSVNVAVLSIRTALALSLPKTDIDALAAGSLLHDIGFGLINDEIINKQGKLSGAEEEVFKTHVIEGVSILQNVDAVPKKAMTAILHHHENMEGSGYPDSLAGQLIPVFGRITAISDAYDLLTTQQPFRKGLSPSQALSAMTKDSSKYDPVILAVFIKLIAQQIK